MVGCERPRMRILPGVADLREYLNTWATVRGRKRTAANRLLGGGSGIRTHDTVSRIHAFQACALSHSAIPPELLRRGQYNLARLSEEPAPRSRSCASAQKISQLTQRTLPASLTS